MSTGTGSTGTGRRLPMSPAKLVIYGAYALGVVATLVAGEWLLAVVLALAIVAAVFRTRWARRPEASDVTRVAALEYRDERDRAIARDGFAAVGVAALLVTVAECWVALVVGSRWIWLPVLQLVLLAVVNTVANQVSAERH